MDTEYQHIYTNSCQEVIHIWRAFATSQNPMHNNNNNNKKSMHENDCVKVSDLDFRWWFKALAHKGSLRLINIQQDGSSDFIRESVMQQTASFYDIYPHIWHHDRLMDYG